MINNWLNETKIAHMMKQLTIAQQLQFITIVGQYQKTYHDLADHQVYNYLCYTKMKAQLHALSNDITGRTGNPIAQAFSGETAALDGRLYNKAGNKINTTIDPFKLDDEKLNGWYANLAGIWGEWSAIKHYYQRGCLVTFSTTLLPNGEVDLKINENGVAKWVEVKNVLTTKKWGKALDQAEEYALRGATDVILEFPQQGVNGIPDLSHQQLSRLDKIREKYSDVNFELRTGANDPSIQTPFDPPANNWGSYLP